jgi:hypothetical protein
MLEEAIRNHEKVHPAEIALAMLSFIQSELPAGGTAAETRFLNLFLPLCDCIFGPMDLTEKDFRHKDGGWMSVSKQWPRPTPSSAMSTSGTSTPGTPLSKVNLPDSAKAMMSYSLDTDPVVKLLGTAGKPQAGSEPLPFTLIEAISKESDHRPSVTFPFKFHALPLPLQESWLASIKQSSALFPGNRTVTVSAPISTDNDLRLLGLLRKGPSEQNQVQLFSQKSSSSFNTTQPDYLRQKSVLHRPQQQYLDPNRGSSTNNPSMTVSPSLQSPSFGLLSPSSRRIQESSLEIQNELPDLMLSMLEYYLFVFLRFPLAAPKGKGVVSSNASSSIPGVNVHRIPATAPPLGTGPPNNGRTTRDSFGETLYYHLFRRCMRHFLPYEVEGSRSIAFGDAKQFPESELFLRICIAMCLESRSRLVPTEVMMELILERRRQRTSGTVHENSGPTTAPVLDLHSLYDLTHTTGKYDSLPTQQQKCLRTLIIHAMLDPSVAQTGLDRQRSPSNLASQKWCLTQCLTVLQQPVYNYIRTTFRFAPIHSTSESSFYGALNIWLIWLEPWNVSQCTYFMASTTMCNRRSACSDIVSFFVFQLSARHVFSTKQATQRIMGSVGGKFVPGKAEPQTQRVLTLPRHNQTSKYDGSVWEPYVAANVYMYAVPLAIFLVRARELDFSKNNFDRSLEIVQRVFRVFTPALVDAVSRHLDLSSNSTGGSFQVEHHRKNLGQFAPSQPALSLSSLKSDMKSLLEEINMQHMKTVRELDTLDWLIGKVEGLFGGGIVSGEEKTMMALVERSKAIVGFPVDYDFLNVQKLPEVKVISKQTQSSRSIRDEAGELTNYGREQLVLGTIKLRPEEVVFGGDKLRANVKSHEISILVELMIYASDFLNESFGLSAHSRILVNLRFFADYRNLAFACLVAFVLVKLF